MRCLRDILDDETYQKYDTYSDINIIRTASFSASTIPDKLRTLDGLLPPPQPPPSPGIQVSDVPEQEYLQDEHRAIGRSVICLDEGNPQPTTTSPDTSHLLWDSPMFPTSELAERSISPSTILALLATDDSTNFTVPVTQAELGTTNFRLQVDGGANRSVTNNIDYLTTSWEIAPYRIGGIGAGITCTAKGIFHIICSDGSVLPVEMFYSAEATETIVSPTDTVSNNSTDFDSWWQLANCRTGGGELRFYKTNGITRCSIPLRMHNKLWYIDQDVASTVYRAKIRTCSDAFVHAINGTTLHNLWHHRLCHAGKFVTDNIDKVVDGVPSLRKRNPFFSCWDCSSGKMTQKIKGFNKDPERATVPGGRFCMDYGFVRGNDITKPDDGPLITSKEGYNCYLLIADEYSRHLWIFLFANKKPPISAVTTFLNTHGTHTGLRRIRTDQGGELAKSSDFRACVQKAGYTLESTGAGASFQSAIVERPHRTLADMMRTMLSGSNLSSKYWSHAIRHAVYVKNRLPHQSLPGKITPYERYTSRRPDLTHLRVFGSHVTVKQPRIRQSKIDTTHTTTGTFLGFTATDRTIWYEDSTTGELKSARHATFDEAHYSSNNRPPYATELMNMAEEYLTGHPTVPLKPHLPLHLIPEKDTYVAQPPSTTFLPPSPALHHPSPTTPLPSNTTPHIIPFEDNDIASPTISSTVAPPIEFSLTSNPHGPSFELDLRIKGTDPTLGLELIQDKDTERILLKSCRPSTPAARIPRWRSTLRNSILVEINGTIIDTLTAATQAISQARAQNKSSISIILIPPEHINLRPDNHVPQIHFDQLNVMAFQHHAAINNTAAWSDPHNPPPVTDAMVFAAMDKGHINPRLTRAFLKRQSDWMDWNMSEFKQLNQYHAQGMFGDPVQRPPKCNILPLIWTYLVKSDGTKKARCVCNGSPSRRGSVTLAHTYAAALDQSGARTFWAITALHNYVAYGADATNAFAEAPPPKAPLYVTIDAQFKLWWEKILKRPPIKIGHVLPVRHALQGHPESPRLWATMIHKILTGPTLRFKATTHEPCLYNGVIDGVPIFMLRQVDDFAVAAPTKELADKLFAEVQKGLKQPLKLLGVLTMFNGLDVTQGDKFIKLSCSTYITKILQGHNWLRPTHSSPLSSPMNHDKRYMTELEQAIGPTEAEPHLILQKEMGFSYRQAIGELLFAAITCRPDILYAIIKLSQYNNKPSRIHYLAVKRVFKYLRDTLHDGLHYWRQDINPALLQVAAPPIPPDTHSVELPDSDPRLAHGYVDSDWAGDTKHRRSISGLCLCFAGAPVVYRSRFQPTISLSSTEAEFIAANEAGKLGLYLRSILNDLDIPQDSATALFEDNAAAIAMANAQRPTRRTRHMDIKHFALLDWVATDQLILSAISTHDNPSDGLTKALGPQLFARHTSTLLGKRKPSYCSF